MQLVLKTSHDTMLWLDVEHAVIVTDTTGRPNEKVDILRVRYPSGVKEVFHYGEVEGLWGFAKCKLGVPYVKMKQGENPGNAASSNQNMAQDGVAVEGYELSPQPAENEVQHIGYAVGDFLAWGTGKDMHMWRVTACYWGAPGHEDMIQLVQLYPKPGTSDRGKEEVILVPEILLRKCRRV